MELQTEMEELSAEKVFPQLSIMSPFCPKTQFHSHWKAKIHFLKCILKDNDVFYSILAYVQTLKSANWIFRIN